MLTFSSHMRHPHQIYLANLIGVFFEYFDYAIYGFSAPFIAEHFFPAKNPSSSLLLTWGIFAVSFLVRPFGAIIFGHFADRIGRKPILTLTVLLMGLSTTAMGLLPTYQEAGLLAPLGLVLCRLFQGLAVSTEYSGCSTYLLELGITSPGLSSGIVTSASGFGVFAASLVELIFHAHWRLPFLVAGLSVGALGFYLRKNLQESEAFLKAIQEKKIQKLPFLSVLRYSPQKVLSSIFLSAYAGIAIIVIEIYFPSFSQTSLGLSSNTALQFSTELAFLEACMAIGFGALLDYWGKRNSLLFASTWMCLGIFPGLMLFINGYFLFGLLLLASLVAAIDGPIAAILNANFPTEIRYTGVSGSYSFGAALIGGLSPSFLSWAQNYWQSPYLLSAYLFTGSFLVFCVMIRPILSNQK